MINLAIFEFTFLAGIQFLLDAVEGAGADYFARSVRFDHVEGDVLFRLPTALVNGRSHLRFCKVAEKMRRDLVLVAFACHCVTEINWSSSRNSDDFVLYVSATGTARGYPAERTVQVERLNVNNGSVVPIRAPASDVNWLPGVTCKTISKLSVIIGSTVVLLMMLKGNRLMSRLMSWMTLIVRRRMERFAREIVDLPLRTTIAQVKPQLWHVFQRQ